MEGRNLRLMKPETWSHNIAADVTDDAPLSRFALEYKWSKLMSIYCVQIRDKLRKLGCVNSTPTPRPEEARWWDSGNLALTHDC